MPRRNGLLAAVLGIGLVGARGADPSPGSHDSAFSTEGLVKADVGSLRDTQLVAETETPLLANTNVIWCGTLQLAWNEAIGLVGEKLRFANQPPIADSLNKESFTRNDLAPGSYVALADFERNHVEAKIREALEQIFHGTASPELIPPVPSNPGPDDFVAYAYLFKNLAFAYPFNDNKPMSFGGALVKNFGFRVHAGSVTADVLEQVSLYDFQSNKDFVMVLKTKAVHDELILANVPPGATLQATIDDVLQRMASHSPEGVSGVDVMEVPKLNFDLRRDFNELEGLTLDPSPTAKIQANLRITKVEQLVRFQLNEKGAVLKSEAVITMKASAIMRHRELVFDQPFLILMKQADAPKPYFAMWVGNASLLVPAK